MNIDVVGRIKPTGHDNPSFDIDKYAHKIVYQTGGNSFSFQHLHPAGNSNQHVYEESVASILNLAIKGFNTCLLVCGESGAGKSTLTAGGSANKPGVVPLLIENLFREIGQDEHYMYDYQVSTKQKITLQMYELYNEKLTDLLRVPTGNVKTLKTGYAPDTGSYVKKGSVIALDNATDGVTHFRQAWSRRIATFTDFGAAKNFSTVIMYLDINLQLPDDPMPKRSRITILTLAGLEKLAAESVERRINEGPTLNQSLIAFSQLIATLANKQYPDRVINYSDSILTSLLQDEFGGNCKTRAVLCLKPQSEANVLSTSINLCKQLVNVHNYPIRNDLTTQMLLTQYRTQLHDYSLQLNTTTTTTQENTRQLPDEQHELKRVKSENLELRDRNEQLHTKLERMQGTFGTMMTSKTDLSTQLLMTEEEKDKVSQTLLEMHLKNNQLKEEADAVKIQYKDKILNLEHNLTKTEIERDKQIKSSHNMKERLKDMEWDRKEVLDEYISLKTNYLAMTKEIKNMGEKNEELSMELLSLVNGKATLMRQMENLSRLSDRPNSREAQAEVDRIRNIVSRLSHARLENDHDLTKDRQTTEKNLFGNRNHFEGEMKKMQRQYDDNQKKLENKLNELKRQVQDANNDLKDQQKRTSEFNAKYLTAQSLSDQLQSQNNRLQHKMKQINEDFRSRLVKYIEDISEFIDKGKSTRMAELDDGSVVRYQHKVNEMLKELKRAHKIRQEQLSNAAEMYRNRAAKVNRKHEELLVAYRDLRQLVEGRDLQVFDLGPDESELQMSDPELVSAQQKEINRLREDLTQTSSHLATLELRSRVNKEEPHKLSPRGDFNVDGKTLDTLRKELREFTNNKQRQLEDERTDLLTRNTMLTEEVEILQKTVDTELKRYKEENRLLREQLGIHDGRPRSRDIQGHSRHWKR